MDPAVAEINEIIFNAIRQKGPQFELTSQIFASEAHLNINAVNENSLDMKMLSCLTRKGCNHAALTYAFVANVPQFVAQFPQMIPHLQNYDPDVVNFFTQHIPANLQAQPLVGQPQLQVDQPGPSQPPRRRSPRLRGPIPGEAQPGPSQPPPRRSPRLRGRAPQPVPRPAMPHPTMQPDNHYWKRYTHRPLKDKRTRRHYYKCLYPTCPVRKTFVTNIASSVTLEGPTYNEQEHNHLQLPPL